MIRGTRIRRSWRPCSGRRAPDCRSPTGPRSSFAEELIACVDPAEQVRLVNWAPRPPCQRSGWRARLHRPRQDHQFSGCYHGHVDALLADAGSGSPPSDCPPPGVTGASARHGGAPYNDLAAVAARVRRVRRSDRRGHHRGSCRQHGRGGTSRRVSMPGLPNSPGATAHCWIMDEVMTDSVSPAGWRPGLATCTRSAR